MITATFLGGPRDGETIALRDARPLNIPILHRPTLTRPPEIDDLLACQVECLTIRPVQRGSRWVLPWRELP